MAMVGIRLVCIIMFTFYICFLRNAVPVNVTDSMIITDSMSREEKVWLMSQRAIKALEKNSKNMNLKICFSICKKIQGCNMNCIRDFTYLKEQR